MMPPPVTDADELAAGMASAWRAGQHVTTESVLANHPDAATSVVARLLYEEICLRQEAGQPVSVASFRQRFPDQASQIEHLLAFQDLLAPNFGAAPAPTFPEVGDRLGEFALLAELGRGAVGRVFLAEQPSLSDRPIVLKVTPISNGERRTLARLQHAHIVPLYAAIDFRERGLQALCMPYLGGLSLDRVLKRLPGDPARRTGRDLLAMLGCSNAARQPVRAFLERASFEQAVCWLGACLADALGHAHERGIVHLDVKPSNVLWAADGQPMLLDFHLAREPIAAGGSLPAWVGGTPGYLPPEQASAMRAVQEGGVIREPVDGRADLFALGMLLFETLTGHLATPSPRQLRRHNPNVSVRLAAVIARCLEPTADQRYADAGSLAADLRACMNDRPARHRGGWRSAVWRGGLFVAGMVVGGLAVRLMMIEPPNSTQHSALSTEDELRTHFREGQDHFRQKRYAEALARFEVCVTIAPERAECWFNRGLTLAAMGQTDRAIEDFEQASERGGSSSAVCFNLAMAHRAAGHTAEAEYWLRETLRHEPGHREAARLLTPESRPSR